MALPLHLVRTPVGHSSLPASVWLSDLGLLRLATFLGQTHAENQSAVPSTLIWRVAVSLAWGPGDLPVLLADLNGNGAAKEGGSSCLRDIKAGPDGAVYVSDTWNHRVLRIPWPDPKGFGQQAQLVAGSARGVGGFGSSLAHLGGPVGIDVVQPSASNHPLIYVVEELNHRVTAWAKGWSSGVLVAGGSGDGSGPHQLYRPQCCAAHVPSASLFVADTGNRRVVRYPLPPHPHPAAGKRSVVGVVLTGVAVDRPCGLFVTEKEGDLYVADVSSAAGLFASGHRSESHHVLLWQRAAYTAAADNTSVRLVAGGRGCGSTQALLNEPRGVCVDQSTNEVFVADSANCRVQLWPALFCVAPTCNERAVKTVEWKAMNLSLKTKRRPTGVCLVRAPAVLSEQRGSQLCLAVCDDNAGVHLLPL